MAAYTSRWTLALLFVMALARPTTAGEAVSFEQQEGSLAIRIGGEPFATYVLKDPRVPRPYFAHLRAPNRIQVTRNYPPVAGQDAIDHDTFHPGLWLAFGDLGGADFWRNKATIAQVKFVRPPTSDEGGGGFTVKNQYQLGDTPVCQEICHIHIGVRPAGYLIVWDSRFSSDDDFAFGDQEEMGLGIRMATPMTVKSGGQILNTDGLKNESQAWGKQADWCDYSGTRDGQSLGVLLVPDPKNFGRSWFHARDYGVLVANPFGRKAFTKGPASRVTVRRGESLRLRFGVLVHSGPTDLPVAYQDCRAAMAADN